MICYHTTDAADQILRNGFRDATGSYGLATHELTGVWLGDSPMDINEGATGDQVLRVEFPDDIDLGDFEIIEEQKPYREWCVPADLINERATVTLMIHGDSGGWIPPPRRGVLWPQLWRPWPNWKSSSAASGARRRANVAAPGTD
jgi:hypothetical protein